MRGYRKRQLKYGVTTGLFVFAVLWLVAALILPEDTPTDVPDWQGSLWLLCGMHFIDIWIETGLISGQTVNAVELFENTPVMELRALPPAALGVGAFYAARKISRTRQPGYILKNGASVLAGYLPALMIAFIAADVNPTLETALALLAFLAVAIYTGAMVISRLTGGLPFFGIASLGTIIIVGTVAIVVAVEVLSTFGPALLTSGIAVGFGTGAVVYARSGGGVLDIVKANVLILLLFAFVGGGLYLSLGGPVPDVHLDSNINETAVEEQVFVHVNEERQSRGVRPLSYEERAHQPAKEHAVDMAERDYFAHMSPDGETVPERYHFCASGENIAKTLVDRSVEVESGTERFTDETELAEGVIQQWMNSPPHRENILRDSYVSGAPAIHIADNEVFAVFAFCQSS